MLVHFYLVPAPSHSLPDPAGQRKILSPSPTMGIFSFAPSNGPFQCLKDLKIHPISLRYSFLILTLQVPSIIKNLFLKALGESW